VRPVDEKITVLIPTSPIPSHPSTRIIFETIDSIRFHLPNAEISILMDGVRPEQAAALPRYKEYARNLVEGILFGDHSRITLCPFMPHTHQVGMVRSVMPSVQTPLVLFVEHDTPLTKDPIDWEGIAGAIERDVVDFVRFLPEPGIHPEHLHLMCGPVDGYPLVKTIQFSARPHVASRVFFEKMLLRFSPKANTFIEDRMHSICQEGGCEGWVNWKMAVYHPEGNKQRSRHLCGREDDPKFDDRLVF
jgi:hypothetical protein